MLTVLEKVLPKTNFLAKSLTETYLKLKFNKTEMIFLVSFYNQKAKTKITSSFNLLKLR